MENSKEISEDFSESEESDTPSEENDQTLRKDDYIKADEEFENDESQGIIEAVQEIAIDTESEGADSIDLEYKERLRKEEELNNILK